MARDHPARMPFDRLFRTKRLLFRALENTPEHSAFIRDIMIEDPATYAQSTNRLLAPLTADEVESDVAGLVKSGLLAVVICLRPTASSSSSQPPPPTGREEEEEEEYNTQTGAENQRSSRSRRPRRQSSSTRSASEEEEEDEQEDPPTTATAIGWLTLDCHTLTLHHRSCTLGIMLAAAHQGQGYGTEAINWALDWAFRVAAMHAVRLSCWSFNERAAALYRRLGFVREGVTREAYYYDCRWYDRVLFSMLDREWAALRGIRA